jgi:hypothetical protein
MFDHTIIRQEKYLRGRTEEEIINLILEGIASSGQDVTYENPKRNGSNQACHKFCRGRKLSSPAC